MSKEPVLIIEGIVAAIMSVATFAVAMGAIKWDAEQMSAFNAMLIALIPLAVGAVGIYITRRSVYSPDTVEQIKEGTYVSD